MDDCDVLELVCGKLVVGLVFGLDVEVDDEGVECVVLVEDLFDVDGVDEGW